MPANLEQHQIALLVMMFNKGIIGHGKYVSTSDVRRRICWERLASHFRIKARFDRVARKLVSQGYLSDDGKSMRVLFLTKKGVMTVMLYFKDYPNANELIDSILKAG